MNIIIFGALCLLSTTVIAQNNLVLAAKERLKHTIIYDGSYHRIPYPNGDVNKNTGVCTDVVIRSYRSLGKDLQQLVHEDMIKDFDQYPKIWGLSKPDSNIDHRRVPNLEVFFNKYGESLPITDNAKDYQPGDIVSWRLANNRPHIGIVTDVRANDGSGRYQIIHNIGWGPQQEDVLFNYKITGHFKY